MKDEGGKRRHYRKLMSVIKPSGSGQCLRFKYCGTWHVWGVWCGVVWCDRARESFYGSGPIFLGRMETKDERSKRNRENTSCATLVFRTNWNRRLIDRLLETWTLTLISWPPSTVHSSLLLYLSSNPTRTDGNCGCACACLGMCGRVCAHSYAYIQKRHVNTNTNLHAPAHHPHKPHLLCCSHAHACPPVHAHTITLLVMPTLSAIRFSFVSVCGYESGMSWVGIGLDIPAGAHICAHMCTHMRERTCTRAFTPTQAHSKILKHTQARVSSFSEKMEHS